MSTIPQISTRTVCENGPGLLHGVRVLHGGKARIDDESPGFPSSYSLYDGATAAHAACQVRNQMPPNATAR